VNKVYVSVIHNLNTTLLVLHEIARFYISVFNTVLVKSEQDVPNRVPMNSSICSMVLLALNQ
jgi:hypothetical protein